MKRNLLIVILVIAAVALPGLTAGCNGELPGNAVAKVGDAYITADKFESAVAEQAQYFGISEDTQPDTFRDLQQWVLENLV